MGLVEVEVTMDDIVDGERRSCHLCPIARAVARAFAVDFAIVAEGAIALPDGRRFPTPDIARAFIFNFDEGMRPVEPFRFTIDTERQLAAIS